MGDTIRGVPLRVAANTPRGRRALALAGAAAVGAGGIVALLRWRLWSSGVPSVAPVPLETAFDPAELARNREYRRVVWGLAAAAVPVAPAAALAVAALGGRWRPAVVRLARGRAWAVGITVGAGLAVVLGVVGLPVAGARWWWGRRYGLVTQDFGPWLLDAGKAVAIEVVVLGLLGAGLAVLVARAARWWWAGLAALVAAATFALGLLAPIVIEPLFQRTRPLNDPALEAQVLDVARRSGVEARDVVVNDASTRTTVANAYVSGFGASRHIVLYDTLLRDFPPDQVRFVVAHELGHVARHHVLKGSTWGAALAVPACLAIFAAVGWRTGFGRPGAGREGADLVDRRLAVAAAAAAALMAASAPLGAWVSRAYEREADWSALTVTRDPHAAIGLQQGLVRRSLGVPDPPRWVQAWFGTHPTALERVAMARRAERSPRS